MVLYILDYIEKKINDENADFTVRQLLHFDRILKINRINLEKTREKNGTERT